MTSTPTTSGFQALMRSRRDRKSTRLNSSHSQISYAVFCLKKKKNKIEEVRFLQYTSQVKAGLFAMPFCVLNILNQLTISVLHILIITSVIPTTGFVYQSH